MHKEEAINQYLQAGFRIFPVNGKIPVNKGWQHTKQNPFLDVKKFTKNYGIVLQTDDLVIDVDVSEKEDGTKKVGKDSFSKLVAETNLDINKTFVVRTGTGGFHIYLKKPKNLVIKEKWRAYPDLEFKSKNIKTGKGSYVVGAESIHLDTNLNYKIVLGMPSDIMPAPAKLLKLIEYIPVELEDIKGLKKYADDAQTISRAKKFLEQSDVAIQGSGGDQQTYIIACRCRSFGLSPQMALDMMLDLWNPRCEPARDITELKSKIYNAYTYDTAPQGHKHPENDFKEVPASEKENDPTDDDIVWGPANKDGTRKSQIQNTVGYFRLTWPTLLQYNLFTDEIEFTEIPQWYPIGKPLVPWTDNDAIFVKHSFAERQKYDINVMGIQEGALIAANRQRYHPLKDYLNDLVWDGKERAKTWLHDYAGVMANEYSESVGLKTLLGAVTRIFEPGCKFDTVLIIEGAQGAGKSRLIEAMGKQWYGDIHLEPHNKDTVAAMRNKWIIEISEMTFIKKAEINPIRSFLSRATDRPRLSHRRNAEDYPRQCIFIGTINPEAVGYLTDTTGNRRFWPVTVPEGFKVKVEKMERDIDQIWAEVVYKYKHEDIDLHLDDEKVQIMARDEVDKRQAIDEWYELIKLWLDKPADDNTYRKNITTMEIWTDCLNGIPRSITRLDQVRITEIMRNLKWKKGSFTRNKKTFFGYSRPKVRLEVLG